MSTPGKALFSSGYQHKPMELHGAREKSPLLHYEMPGVIWLLWLLERGWSHRDLNWKPVGTNGNPSGICHRLNSG